MRCGLFQKCVSVRHYKYGDAKYSPYSGSVAEIPASVLWCQIETETRVLDEVEQSSFVLPGKGGRSRLAPLRLPSLGKNRKGTYSSGGEGSAVDKE